MNETNTVQEEADTRMLLHAKQVAADNDSVIIVADDTDVLIICMAVQVCIGCNLQESGQSYSMSTKCVQLLFKEHVLLCWECLHLQGATQ